MRTIWTDISLDKRSLCYAGQVFKRSVVEPITLYITEDTRMYISEYLDGQFHGRLQTLTIDSCGAANTFDSLVRWKSGRRELIALESLEIWERGPPKTTRVVGLITLLPKLRTLRLDGLFPPPQIHAQHLVSVELWHHLLRTRLLGISEKQSSTSYHGVGLYPNLRPEHRIHSYCAGRSSTPGDTKGIKTEFRGYPRVFPCPTPRNFHYSDTRPR